VEVGGWLLSGVVVGGGVRGVGGEWCRVCDREAVNWVESCKVGG